MNAPMFHILVIDGNPEDQLTYLRLLQEGSGARYRVSCASTGEEGLATLDRQAPDCVLLEYRLPDMDGLFFLSEFHRRRHSAATPVLLLTGQGNEKVAVEAMKAGATDYLLKGELNGELLTRAVKHAIEKKHAEIALQERSASLEANVEELKRANRQIIEQQRSVIEEERLKVLLQMAGATAHELNQPLMALLGSIELIQGGPEIASQDLARIESAGRRIAEVVKKIQSLRHDHVKPYPGTQAIINLNQELCVLSVEDSEDDFLRLKKCLDEIGNLRVLHAGDCESAFQAIGRTAFDIIFLDYILPDATALDVMKKLHEHHITTPVVIFTGQGDEIIASQTIQAGAYDYLPKSQLSSDALAKIIRNTLEKRRLRREVETMTQRLSEMAIRDELTGLYNKRYFTEALDREIDRALRYGQKLSLCMADLDHFKQVNDSYGHPAGDSVLKKIGGVILRSTRKSDIACRYGGEEFAVILPDINLDQAVKFGERLRRQVNSVPFEPEGGPLGVTISLGIAQYDSDGKMDLSRFVKEADERLYLAKNSGRNRVVSAMTS